MNQSMITKQTIDQSPADQNPSNQQPTKQQAYDDSHALAGFACVYQQNVVWGELDAFNHLNNVVYYRYAESARIDYLCKLGLFGSGEVMVLAQSSCTYLRPVHFPDCLQIGVRCKKLGTTSMVFEYCFYSEQQQAVVATAEVVVVSLDESGTRKQPWTQEQRQRVQDFEIHNFEIS